MLSDWDLDAAVISASDPCLQLALVFASQRDKVTLQGMNVLYFLQNFAFFKEYDLYFLHT